MTRTPTTPHSRARAKSRQGSRSSRNAQGLQKHIIDAAQILLGLTLSCLIGFVIIGVIIGVIVLIYEVVK
jgi:hypothetical protein